MIIDILLLAYNNNLVGEIIFVYQEDSASIMIPKIQALKNFGDITFSHANTNLAKLTLKNYALTLPDLFSHCLSQNILTREELTYDYNASIQAISENPNDDLVIVSLLTGDKLSTADVNMSGFHPVKTTQMKQIAIWAAKFICGSVGACSGLGYIRSAFSVGSEIGGHPAFGIVMAGGTLIAVSCYTMWGWIACIDQLMPERIQAFVLKKKFECYNQLVYPFGVLFIGMSSLIPIGYFMYLVNGANNAVFFFVPSATDSGLRIKSLDDSFSQIQPTRKILNLFRTSLKNEHPEILATFVHQLQSGLNSGLQDVPNEKLRLLLTNEAVVKNSRGELSFNENWEAALKILLNKAAFLQTKRKNIFLLKPFFSNYLMKMGGTISAASLIAIELYLSFLAGGAITSNVYIKTVIALGVVGPIGYLQYLLVSGIWVSFYEGLISRIFGVSTDSWLNDLNPVASRVRVCVATLIASISWGHILALINDLFPTAGLVRLLALTILLPSNCLLLLAGMLELSEKFHIFLVSKSTHSDRAKAYYKIKLLIDEIQTANPDLPMMIFLTNKISEILDEKKPIELLPPTVTELVGSDSPNDDDPILNISVAEEIERHLKRQSEMSFSTVSEQSALLPTRLLTPKYKTFEDRYQPGFIKNNTNESKKSFFHTVKNSEDTELTEGIPKMKKSACFPCCSLV